MEKMKLHSPDFAQENIAKVAELFPNCVTESKSDDGKLKRAIDFDQLKQVLSASIVDGPHERYQLTWPGKREALITANAPIAKTLRPCREESVDFDTTQNLFIEGDNLDALKLLQETYLGKVKMIYIDPPYNTRNDFIYKDDFSENTEEFLIRSNQSDIDNNRLSTNTESSGRYHSKWLSMIYSRLKLARNLLQEDGVVFISIDDIEVANLQKICAEIFGDINILGSMPVVMNLKGNQDAFGFAETHEYIIVCAKSKSACKLNNFDIDEETLLKEWSEDEFGLFKEADNLRATGINAPREKRKNLWYPIFLNNQTEKFYVTENNEPINDTDTKILPINPEGEELSWYWSKSTFSGNQHNLIPKKTVNGWQFYKKQRPQLGDLPTKKPKSFFYKSEYSTATATTKLKELFGAKIFNNPKPIPFIGDLLKIGSDKKSIVLDFFGGSASTAHALMELNSEDGGNRKFIMVQWPEVCDEKSEAYKAGYKTIAEIGKDRIRRAGNKIKADNSSKENIDQLDTGFRVLKIDSSNMKDVYYSPDSVQQSNLLDQISNIKEDRSDEDLLFQVLLDWGVDLTLSIDQEIISGKKVFFVDENALAACFEKNINEEFVKILAARHPLRVVFRDSGFENDSVKINIEQIFKLISPNTEVKTI